MSDRLEEIKSCRETETPLLQEDVDWLIRELEAARKALKAAKISHLVLEGDPWYSCPVSGECANDAAGKECNCGADAHNKAIEEALQSPKESK